MPSKRSLTCGDALPSPETDSLAPGGFGTILSQNAWLPVFRTLGADLWAGGRLLVSRASNVFDASGKIVDSKVNDALRKFLEGFVAHVRAHSESVEA